MTEPKWVNEQALIDLHDMQIKIHGGMPGMRDVDLLSWSLAQPKDLYLQSKLTPSLIDLAAKYAFHIVKNHPFNDANKRTGLLATLIFLEINGIQIELNEGEAYHIIRDLAADKITCNEFAKWLTMQIVK